MSGLENALFQLKFTTKQLQRSAAKAAKEKRMEEKKVEQAIQQGQRGIAEIKAREIARKETEVEKLLNLASRVDSVASRVQTAITMQRVTKSMAQVTRGMDLAEKNMDLEKISKVMEKFETQFENVEVSSMHYENATDSISATSVPQDRVNQILNNAERKVLGDQLPDTEDGVEERADQLTADEQKAKEQEERENKLAERLKQLRQPQGAS